MENPQQMELTSDEVVNTNGGADVDTNNTEASNTQTSTEENMTITETISDAISGAVTGTIDQARQVVLGSIWKKINSLCKKYNVSTEELLSNVPPKDETPKVKKELAPDDKRHALKGIKLEPKYTDGVYTWPGRGLRPRWLREAMEKDPTLTLDSFLIKK